MISLEYKDYYNFGQPGIDNLSILNKLIRANEYFKITKDDTVLIMLTSWDRIDYYDDLKIVGMVLVVLLVMVWKIIW